MEAFQETVNYVKTDLMPEYNFDEFRRDRDENQSEFG
jgi:hypothetical protein